MIYMVFYGFMVLWSPYDFLKQDNRCVPRIPDVDQNWESCVLIVTGIQAVN